MTNLGKPAHESRVEPDTNRKAGQSPADTALALRTGIQALIWHQKSSLELSGELDALLHDFGYALAKSNDEDHLAQALHAALDDPAAHRQIEDWNKRAQQQLRPDLTRV